MNQQHTYEVELLNEYQVSIEYIIFNYRNKDEDF